MQDTQFLKAATSSLLWASQTQQYPVCPEQDPCRLCRSCGFSSSMPEEENWAVGDIQMPCKFCAHQQAMTPQLSP